MLRCLAVTVLQSSEDGTFSINIMLPPGAGDEEQGTVSKPEATFIAKAAPTSDDEDKVDDEAKKMRRSQLKLMRAQESFSRIADPSQDGTTQAAAKPEVGAAMAAAPDAPTPPVPPARGASRAPPQRPTGADGSETPQPAHGADGPTSMQPITGEFEVRASPSEALDTLFGLNLRRAWLGVRVDVQALMQAVEQAGAGALEHVDVLSAAFQPPKPVDTTTDRPDRLRSASSMSQAALSDVNDVRSFVSTVVTNVSPVARLWVEIERLRFATPTAAIGPPLRAFLNPPLPDIPALYSKEQAASNKKDKTSFDTTFTAVSALLSSYFNADRVGLRFAVGASLASISEAGTTENVPPLHTIFSMCSDPTYSPRLRTPLLTSWSPINPCSQSPGPRRAVCYSPRRRRWSTSPPLTPLTVSCASPCTVQCSCGR